MGKRVTALAAMGLACIMAIQAAGRKDNESHEADNPDGLISSINIEEKKPGKYNFYIEAKDKAANTDIAGPDNIYLDPESDLPVTTIINPREHMHIQGNLNIAGICADDDAVDYVELTVTRGGDGKGEEVVRARAEGAGLWSYMLDTTDTEAWPDGAYTVTAWGVDINGLSGISDNFRPKAHKKHQVSWHLDRKKPEIRVTSHETGALVVGKVRLSGTVYDGNGVTSLRYSPDEGVRYLPVSFKYDKKNNIYNWNVTLDTKRYEDGPAVIWFEARDNMGTAGVTAHLLQVNNTRPEVEIVYPPPEAVVSGVFTAAGYAAHPVGLKSVSWKLGKASGEFALIAGNPWWTQKFDIRGQRASSLELEIRAEDLSGNVTVARQKYKVDQSAGLPTVTLEEPIAGAVLEGDELKVRGIAVDNDAVASVLYSLDSQATVTVPCAGYFQFTIPRLSPGTHTLEIWARDYTGVEGPKVTVKGIVVPEDGPKLQITSASAGTGKAVIYHDFYSGMEIHGETGSSLELRASSVAGIQSASYQLGSKAPAAIPVKKGRNNSLTCKIPIPPDSDFGLVRVEVRATDIHNRETVLEEYIRVTDLTAPWVIDAPELIWVRPDTSLADGRIWLLTRRPLTGIFNGPALESAEIADTGGIIANGDSFDVSIDEYGRVRLLALATGNYGPMRLTLTSRDGQEFTTGEYHFSVSSGGPELEILEISNPALRKPVKVQSFWVQNEVGVVFRAQDADGLASVDVSLDLGNSWQSLALDSGIDSAEEIVWSRTLDISSFEDGLISISIRAVNRTNRHTVRTFSVQKDTRAPQAALIVPVSEARVNGTIRLGIAVHEAGNLSRVSYYRPESEKDDTAATVAAISAVIYDSDVSDAGTTHPPRFFDVLLDSAHMPLDENMRFVFEDAAGNRCELDVWPFIIDEAMDVPMVHIILPQEDEVIMSDFEVSGVMYDDDTVRRIYWRINEGTERILEAENGFSLPISLAGLTDNEHTVTVAVEDIYGVRSEPVSRNFRVSLAEPSAQVSLPDIGAIVRETVEISGTAFDENGIDRIHISLDNGNTFNDAICITNGNTKGNTNSNTENVTDGNAINRNVEWAYRYNSTIFEDGPHAVFVRVYDACGISALYSSLINLDNTPPELSLDSPADGDITAGMVTISGRALDHNMEVISVELRSLEGETIPETLKTLRMEPAPLITGQLDLSGLTDGRYNIEVRAADKAGNTARVSRNIELARERRGNVVEILYPLENEYLQGAFNLYGYADGVDQARTVTLSVNGNEFAVAEVTPAGYYRFPIDGEQLEAGWNRLVVRSTFGGKETVQSAVRSLHYQPYGAWITIDSLAMGDFAYERPWLTGRAGYALSEEDEAMLADKDADKELKAGILGKFLDKVEISFDNGTTFVAAGKSREKDADWRYRLETGEMQEGAHFLVVRATMKNGETAVTRTLLRVDKTPPVIRLVTPESGGRYNQELDYVVMASDNVELAGLTYHLRKGDKSAYEVPGFIQGLYFEFTIPPFIRQISQNAPGIFTGGATYMDFGVGLSFFDDNVKIQAQYGFMTQDLFESLGGIGPLRYGGQVLSLKLLANVYTLPFGSFVGPDWDWLSVSFTLGANFSLFDIARQGYTQSGDSTWLSALIGQVEFPKVTIPKRKSLRTFSLFTEGQMWFVPTDVNASLNHIETVIPHLTVGLRMYIF